MCMFHAPKGAYNLGHVGWAFSITGTSQWICGSTEEVDTGTILVPPGPMSNDESWYKIGTFAECRAAFGRQMTVNGKVYHDAGYYETYKCITTKWSHVSDAWNTAQIMLTSGFAALGNNCLWKAVMIMSHYDPTWVAPYIDDGATDPPTLYYDALIGFEGAQSVCTAPQPACV